MSKQTKLICFDLDGVLIDAKMAHFHALNDALYEVDYKYMISPKDHVDRFDGKPTSEKLRMLHEERGLPKEKMDQINRRKQELTIEWIIAFIEPSKMLTDLFKSIKTHNNTKIAVVSNSIGATVNAALAKLDLLGFVDIIVSNEDAPQKPSPAPYLHAMKLADAAPANTLILEDSAVGREAAYSSGANLYPVIGGVSTTENMFTWAYIMEFIGTKTKVKTPWSDNFLTVVIPMAGAGSRFKEEGFVLPKPLIDVVGEPMIKRVVQSLNIKARYVFIVQEEHVEKYNIDMLLRQIVPGCVVVTTNGLTRGAAETVLLARDYIGENLPLMIVNSDQFIKWDSNNTMYNIYESGVSAAILTFQACDRKWSYCEVDNDGYVTRVAEKEVISEHATVGVYYWKNGGDFFCYAEEMIAADKRVNNEFYVCPVFNQALESNPTFTIKTYQVESMYGLGTPKDLYKFLDLVADGDVKL